MAGAERRQLADTRGRRRALGQNAQKDPTLDYAAVGVAHVSPDGHFLHVNRKLCEILGYTEAELVQRTFVDVTHQNDRGLSKLAERRLLAGEVSDYYLEKRYIRSDGGAVWVGLTVSAVRGPRGEYLYGIGVVQDIGERKESEDRLSLQYVVTRILSESVSLEVAVTRVLAACAEALECEVSTFWSPSGDTLRCDDVWHSVMAPSDAFPRARGDTCKAGEGLAGRTWGSGRPEWGPASFAVPVLHRDEVLGVVEILGHGRRPQGPAWRALIRMLTDLLGQFMVRSRAETSLRQREAQHRAVLDAALDGIVTIDQFGIIHEWNPAAERMFGYPRDVAIGRELAQLMIPARLIEQHRRGLRRYLETGVEVVIGKRLQLPATRRDGSEFPAEVSITRIGTGEPPFFTGHIRDITEREQAQNALRESEERLRVLINAAPDDPVQMKDAKGRWLEANAAALRLFGLHGVDFHGKTDVELAVFAEGQPQKALLGCAETDEQAWRNREVSRVEEAIPTERGEIVYDVVKVPIFDHHGCRQDLVILARDITALKLAEAEQVRAYEEALRTRDEFLSIASHELRTPATSLLLAVQALKALSDAGSLKQTPDELLRKFLDTCCRQSRQLAVLIDRLLDVGRIHIGALHLEREALDLVVLVRETLASMEQQLRRSGCQVTCETPSPVVGKWDRARLIEVFANLLSNAMKYAPGKPVEIFVSGSSERARVSIRDHGIGIDREFQRVIFEKFDRGASNENSAGMGLGLYLVREIVHAHGGKVELASELGLGSTFTVLLPLEPPPPSSRDGLPGPAAAHEPKAVDR